MDFRVAGAFEFFKDDVVHARAGVDQSRGDNRERPAFLDIARRAKKSLGSLERVGVDTARENLAAGRDDRVMRARQTGNGVEQDHYVSFVLDQSLRFFDHHIGDLNVAGRGFVKG